jgi:hypothetical protein
MEKIVIELKQLIAFKETTDIGDIVLIAAKQPQMLMYAYVQKIERDQSRKDEWWHIHMTILSIPLQKITWTLRTAQMTGQEIFTMGGEERFLKAIDLVGTKTSPSEESRTPQKIVPFKRIK